MIKEEVKHKLKLHNKDILNVIVTFSILLWDLN